MSIVPNSRPQMDRRTAEGLLSAHGVKAPAIIGRRGYYRDTMGVPGKNDRGLYDDAIMVVSSRLYKTFNANTDPSRSGGRLAVLQPGVWQYKQGMHHPSNPNGYPCLVQAAPVTVLRDNGVKETGEFYIHIHHGGYNLTSSEGCQTIHPDQWDEFFHLACGEMEFYELEEIPYVLTVNPNI